jgi:hypothetical protein
MRGKHVKIELSANARRELEKFAKTGTHSVKLVNRAKIILCLDECYFTQTIAIREKPRKMM